MGCNYCIFKWYCQSFSLFNTLSRYSGQTKALFEPESYLTRITALTLLFDKNMIQAFPWVETAAISNGAVNPFGFHLFETLSGETESFFENKSQLT